MNEIEQNKPEQILFRRIVKDHAREFVINFLVYGGVIAFIEITKVSAQFLLGEGRKSATVTIAACLIGLLILWLWEKKWSKQYKALSPSLFSFLNRTEELD